MTNRTTLYVDVRLADFYSHQCLSLKKLSLEKILLEANPYLLKAKGIAVAAKLVDHLLNKHLSLFEEAYFGDFSEGLAAFTAKQTYELIESIDHGAAEHNGIYTLELTKVLNRFTREFLEDFCQPDGAIDWAKLVTFNSGNLDLDEFFDA